MSLAVGDLCTVVYADGGVRVALPIEAAAIGQNGFLADFGNSGTGVPIRIRTVQEVAATVPDMANDPRLQRVVGTIVRDASQVAFFVPLGVMPEATLDPTPSSTFFVVFADTCNIQQIDADGVTTQSMYRRKSGEYDIEIRRWNVPEQFREFFPYQSRTYYTKGVTISAQAGGVLREEFRIPNITVREIVFGTSGEFNENIVVQSDQTTSFYTQPGSTRFIAPPPQVGLSVYQSYEFYERRLLAVTDYLGSQTIYPDVTTTVIAERPVTWIPDDEYFPYAMARLRTNLDEWPELPAAVVYHLPRAADAPDATLNEILPTGVTDYSPLEIISGDYPPASHVVSRIASRVTDDGVREVRFFTAMATVGGQARVQELIDEIVGSLQASYGEIVHSITVAPGNDWLGALADSAEDMPDA